MDDTTARTLGVFGCVSAGAERAEGLHTCRGECLPLRAIKAPVAVPDSPDIVNAVSVPQAHDDFSNNSIQTGAKSADFEVHIRAKSVATSA